MTQKQVLEEAIKRIAKSEKTGWQIFATDARKLLENALRDLTPPSAKAMTPKPAPPQAPQTFAP